MGSISVQLIPLPSASGGPETNRAAIIGVFESVVVAFGADRADAHAATFAGGRARGRYDTLSSEVVAAHNASQVFVTSFALTDFDFCILLISLLFHFFRFHVPT